MNDRRTPQVIRADEAYAPEEFRRRIGCGEDWLQELFASGQLRRIRLGRKSYIRGCDWLALLDRLAEEENP